MFSTYVAKGKSTFSAEKQTTIMKLQIRNNELKAIVDHLISHRNNINPSVTNNLNYMSVRPVKRRAGILHFNRAINCLSIPS